MLRSSATRWVLGVVAVIAVLGLLRFKPWQHGGLGRTGTGNSDQARQELSVGFLPVT